MEHKIKLTIKNLIELLGFESVEINVTEQNGIFVVDLQAQDERAFLGKDNERFDAFSHLAKKILVKVLGENVRFVIDVNNLRSKNDESLKIRADILADRARSFKKDMEFPPMTSYERRVVHSALEGSPFIKTESVGEGKERRLVIRYIGEN